MKEQQEYLEKKEEEVVRLRLTCKELKEDNEHLLMNQASTADNQGQNHISDEVIQQLEELKTQNQELIDQNDSLVTQRKSLQKAREGLQKDLSKILKEKDQLDSIHQSNIQEIENRHLSDQQKLET